MKDGGEEGNKKKASSELEHLPIFNPPDLRAYVCVYVGVLNVFETAI